MNKKRFNWVAVLVIVVLALTVLVACNSYKWTSIGGGNPGGETTSNGGYFVKQGDYAFFINGYLGNTDDNKWGKAFKQSIMRANINEDGSINNASAKVVVPKIIYNKSLNSGFAVYGDWIYYATPNNDADRSGTASTIHTDFMRTKIDGSVTQLINTINSRETEFFFAPNRILYFLNNTIYYIDFTGMKSNKNIDNGKGATTGTLVDNVESVLWKYDNAYTRGQNAKVDDYIFYTQKLTGDNSYEFYNNTYAIKPDGSDKKLIITNTTYLAEAEKENYVNFPNKVFNVKLMKSVVEANDVVTLYYTKNININQTSTSIGLYMSQFSLAKGLDTANEKQLTALAPTSVYPLSFAQGALVLKDSNYCLVDGKPFETVVANDNVYANVVIGKSATIQYVLGSYAYYTEGTSATTLYKINLIKGVGEAFNETIVLKEGIKADWLSLEFVGTKFYFFATDDYGYIHSIDLITFDADDKDAKSDLVGVMTGADAEAKAKAEEEAKKDK